MFSFHLAIANLIRFNFTSPQLNPDNCIVFQGKSKNVRVIEGEISIKTTSRVDQERFELAGDL